VSCEVSIDTVELHLELWQDGGVETTSLLLLSKNISMNNENFKT